MISFYRDQMNALRACDPEILNGIINEGNRQREHIELIASENYVSDAILEAAGSCLTNKYAEGYPGNRFYGGCTYVDEIERIAIDRAKKLFKTDHVNVQPHSGSHANTAAYFALLNSGDTVMGMGLKSGGHLTHGSKVNISGKIFNFVQYGVNKETGLLDYDKIRIKAEECKPKLIVAGASAYPRSIDFKAFRDIADSVGAYLMVDMAHIAGLVATGLHESPIPYADIVTTTTHKTLRGPRGGMILCKEQFAEAVDKAVFPCCQGGPLMHIIAAKAVCFKEALDPSFIDYQKQVIANAKTFEHELIANGIDLVTGGTDNHLLVLKTGARTGLDVQNDLESINISCNKETIPGDQRTAIETSGIRIGTPAITTRGLKENDVKNISQIIARVISGDFNPEFEKEIVREILSGSYKETLLDVIHRIKTNL